LSVKRLEAAPLVLCCFVGLPCPRKHPTQQRRSERTTAVNHDVVSRRRAPRNERLLKFVLLSQTPRQQGKLLLPSVRFRITGCALLGFASVKVYNRAALGRSYSKTIRPGDDFFLPIEGSLGMQSASFCAMASKLNSSRRN